MERLIKNLNHNFPALRIVYCYSPPFRELLPEEERSVLRNIYKSQARILFIGLGCPKQELWMARHVGKIQAVMLGVGAAFDFHSGNIKQAPAWLQNKGLEWLFRLLIEPGRLWKRYLRHNPRFVALVMTELAFKRGPQP
jgi:N-acetylglucosaminyldiphosphoundecaprenol N-acetyl-beta-D-mannosaminyltransferase